MFYHSFDFFSFSRTFMTKLMIFFFKKGPRRPPTSTWPAIHTGNKTIKFFEKENIMKGSGARGCSVRKKLLKPLQNAQ